MSMPLKTKAESMLMISMGTSRAKANAAAVLPEAVGPRMKRALGVGMVLGCDAEEARAISGFPKVGSVLKEVEALDIEGVIQGLVVLNHGEE